MVQVPSTLPDTQWAAKLFMLILNVLGTFSLYNNLIPFFIYKNTHLENVLNPNNMQLLLGQVFLFTMLIYRKKSTKSNQRITKKYKDILCSKIGNLIMEYM